MAIMIKNQHFKEFLRYVSSNVASMVGISLYIFADTFFIANGINMQALAALNIALPMYSVISGIGIMLGVGGSALFALAKNSHEKNKFFTISFVFGLIISIPFVFSGIFFPSDLSYILGANSETIGYTSIYLSMNLIFTPAFIINQILRTFLRNDDNPKTAMIAMLIASLSNIILDYIFIYPLKMGMFGAILATCLAPIISILIQLSHFTKKRHTFKLIRLKIQKTHFSELFKICSIGFPTFIIEMSAGLLTMVFNFVILGISGNVGVAAYGIIANVVFIANAIFNGISQGIQPLISKAYAKGESVLIKKNIKWGAVTTIITGGALFLCGLLFPDLIVEIFNKENNTMLAEIAEHGIKIHFSEFIFLGINYLAVSVLSSLLKPKSAFIISALRGFIIIIMLTLILSQLFGMTGVWLATPITEFLVSIIGVIAITITLKSLNKLHSDH